MSQDLFPTPTLKKIALFGVCHEGPSHRGARPMAGVSENVDYGRVAVFTHLEGQLILCNSGHLWVTIENDRVDHVLDPGQCLFVPTQGKVIIGGKGRYTK
jgi:hypothetical protein